MRKFRSHKIVEAEAIEECHRDRSDPLKVYVTLASGGHLYCDAAIFARYWPVRGDYFVRYADGYESVSPKMAFEDGYTEIGGEAS